MEGEDEALTMEEYMDLQEEAIQKYPWKFDKCFYSQGAVRQPLYICLDCSLQNPAAICYSCSISCHSNHSITEIGMKRNFLCQCGTSSFSTPCSLLDGAEKDVELCKLNEQSIIPSSLHNFNGKFCYCDSDYDEHSSKPGSFMLQCKLCEDWFHSTCITDCPSDENSFGDFFCKNCVTSSHFLTDNYDKMSYQGDENQSIRFNCKSFTEEKTDNDINSTQLTEDSKLAQIQNDSSKVFFAKNELYSSNWWMENVCKCSDCSEAISKDPMQAILMDNEREWTPEPEVSEEEDYENALNSLKNTNRTALMDGMYACKEFGDKLKAFLLPFAKDQKIVTKEDIAEFIAKCKDENA